MKSFHIDYREENTHLSLPVNATEVFGYYPWFMLIHLVKKV